MQTEMQGRVAAAAKLMPKDLAAASHSLLVVGSWVNWEALRLQSR